jgi:hypothetical protein
MVKRVTTVRDPASAVDIELHEPEARRTLTGSGNYREGVADPTGRGGRAALIIYLVTCIASRQYFRKLKG